MGTSIELKVGGISLSYAKNGMGPDFGFLFQEGDLASQHCDQINYEYHEEHPELADDLAEAELVFVRSLSRTATRLNVIGHTLKNARAEYEAIIAYERELASFEDEDINVPELMSFDEFCTFANRYPLEGLSRELVDFDLDPDPRRSLAQGRFAELSAELERLPPRHETDMYWSEASFLSHCVGVMSACSLLLIFSLNPANADAKVVWEFGAVVNSGYVNRDAFQPGARRTQKTLIATEGASDARILRRALDLLRPDVADFFRFIDGQERHHFWGTGNIVKFAEGLQRIDVQNKILFVLDNDAEGVEAYRKLQDLTLPANLQSMLLPDCDALRAFPAFGPEGLGYSDINGRAAAIECYLDLRLPGRPSARVVWSNYKAAIDTWHGALEFKETYDQYFMRQSGDELVSSDYDTSKLVPVLDAIIQCVSRIEGDEPAVPELDFC